MTHQLIQNRLSIARIEKARQCIDSIFLDTPQYFCEPLSEYLQCQILLKIETQNPISCFKGRGSDWLVSQLNNENPIFCASAGNFGQAMAYACRKRGIDLTVYASTKANVLKLERMKALGATVVLFGEDFDAAKAEARRMAKDTGARFVEDSLDIETVEGAGTIGLELINFPQKIDYALIALGNGALFNGIAKVFKEKSRDTQVIAIQASGAPAMIHSWKSGKLINVDKVETIADGIAVRLPIPQALEDMRGLADDGLLVEEESIIKAMKLLHTYAGLIVETSAAVGIAAILENPGKFRGKTVATIICGGNLTEKQVKDLILT